MTVEMASPKDLAEATRLLQLKNELIESLEQELMALKVAGVKGIGQKPVYQAQPYVVCRAKELHDPMQSSQSPRDFSAT